LTPVAASCFVMIIAQSAATARSYAVKHRERVDENADILGLSAANAAAALSGAFVVNGSPTQTAMADGAGARSQVAQLAFAAVVAVVLVFLTGPLQYLPRCVLASIVFTIAVGMIDVEGLAAIKRESRGEYLLALFTAAAVPAIGVEQGILLAIAASLVRHVRHSYRPFSMVLVPGARERWEPAAPGLMTDPGLIVYRFGADLFYANADRFADQVRDLVAGAPEPVRWFIIDCAPIFDLDYTAARTVRDLIDELKTAKVGLVLGRVNAFLRSDLVRHGVAGPVGEDRIFDTLHEAIAAVGAGGRLAGGTKSALAG
jgi:sulfate permease, SulP family